MNCVTVAIPTLNRIDYLIKTIEQVITFKHEAIVEILIIDQTDEENIEKEKCEVVKNWQEKGTITYLKSDFKSLTHSRNIALNIAKGDIVIFLDDDVLLHKDFFNNHIRHYQKSDVIAVAGMVYQRKERFSSLEINNDNFLLKTQPAFDPNHGSPDYNWNDMMIGCNHSVLKKAAIQIHGYDEHYPGYFEDSDFSFRLHKSKTGNIVYDKDAYVIHLRAPVGGCKISKTRNWNEVDKVIGYALFYFRFPEKNRLVPFMQSILRAGPLRKENVMNIIRQPVAWISLIWALFIAFKVRHIIKSPF